MKPWEEYQAQQPAAKPWEEYRPQQSAPAPQQSAPTDPDRPASKPSRWYDDLNAGIASGASRIVRGVGTLLPDEIVAPLERHGIIPTAQDVKTLQGMADTTLGKVGDVGMDVATVAGLPLGAVAKGAEYVPALARAMQARGFLPALGRTADVAATQAGVGAMVSPDDRTSGAAWGAAGGAGGHVLGRAMGGIVRPTAEARTLMDRGVALTPGQAAGPGTFVNKAEQWASSNPVAGIPIRNAQRRALQESNVAAAQSVANMVDENVRLGLPPSEAIERTRDAIGKTYDKSLEGMEVPGFVADTFMLDVLNRAARDFPMLEKSQVNQMSRFVMKRVGDTVHNAGGTLSGRMLKQLDSELGAHIRNLRSSTNAADKTAAPAWAELQQSLREVMEMSHANPEQSAMLRNANAAYRQLLALEKARLPGSEQFTPRQLARQVEKMNLGNTELGNVSRAMTAALPNTVPDSGTAERLIANALPAMLVGGGAGAQGLGFDTLGTGMMAAGALGSRPGARFMTGGYGLQEALAQALRRATPAITRNVNNGND